MPSRLNPDAIRSRMKEVGIPSLASLSNKSGLSQATIDRIMHRRCGNCNSQTVQMLADALKCSPFDLYTEEALTEGTALAEAVAVADAVAEAVNEAVNAVVSEVAPNADPQEVAKAIPDISVAPVVDLNAYFEHIKDVHRQELANLTEIYKSREADHKRHINALYTVLGALLIALIISFMI